MGSAAPRNCAHTALMDGSLRPIVDEDRGEHPSLFTMTQTKRIDSFLTFLHALAPTATACFPCPSCLSRHFRQPNLHSIVLCPLPWVKPSDEKKRNHNAQGPGKKPLGSAFSHTRVSSVLLSFAFGLLSFRAPFRHRTWHTKTLEVCLPL